MHSEFTSKIKNSFIEKQQEQETALNNAQPAFEAGQNEHDSWPEMKTTLIKDSLTLIKAWIKDLKYWIMFLLESIGTGSSQMKQLSSALYQLEREEAWFPVRIKVVLIRVHIFLLSIIKFIKQILPLLRTAFLVILTVSLILSLVYMLKMIL